MQFIRNLCYIMSPNNLTKRQDYTEEQISLQMKFRSPEIGRKA